MVELAWPAAIFCATASAVLIGIAKPAAACDWNCTSLPAVSIPMT